MSFLTNLDCLSLNLFQFEKKSSRKIGFPRIKYDGWLRTNRRVRKFFHINVLNQLAEIFQNLGFPIFHDHNWRKFILAHNSGKPYYFRPEKLYDVARFCPKFVDKKCSPHRVLYLRKKNQLVRKSVPKIQWNRPKILSNLTWEFLRSWSKKVANERLRSMEE
jgi:hypothetical protein